MIMDGAYVISVIGNHWITLYVDNNNKTQFDSFRVEYIPKEI